MMQAALIDTVERCDPAIHEELQRKTSEILTSAKRHGSWFGALPCLACLARAIHANAVLAHAIQSPCKLAPQAAAP